MNWETVIGLEIHVQLATRSKIFSGAATAFGAPPNSQACAVDLAMPGALPVLNEAAVRCAVLFGLGIGAEIHRRSVFDRKNYFYPDLPKGYQVSQLDHPIIGRGELEVTLPDGDCKRIGITRAHLEEDAGKSLHEDFQGMTGIDLNRAGTPLLEIVTEPDMRGAGEAVACLKAIHALVTCLGVCDGNMAEGSLRCDVNISLRPAGSGDLGERTEIKNLNSFRFVEKAIRFEAARQQDILEDGGVIRRETRLYDEVRNETRPMRGKEQEEDYRYFPEPDLLPVVIDEAYIDALREQLPELPGEKRQRFETEHGLGGYDAGVLSASAALADYFEAVAAACGDPKRAANWVQVEVLGQLNREGGDIAECPLPAEELGALIRHIGEGSISGKMAKQVFAEAWGRGGGVDAIIEEQGLQQVSDSGALEAAVTAALAAHPEQAARYRTADEARRKKLLGFLVGQVMKESKGQANPRLVHELLAAALERGED